MNYLTVRKKFINKLVFKFQKDYSIDLRNWKQNPYIRLKYIYISELSALLSFFAFNINLKPNTITYCNIILALLAPVFFIIENGNFIYLSLIIYFSKNILDNVDGFIAREKKLTSKYGAKLDILSGHIYYYSILTSLVIHNYSFSSEKIILIIGFSFLFLDLTYSKSSKVAQKLNLSRKKILNKKIYSFLKLLNFDGRTKITDIIILIILLEVFLNINLLSKIIIITFFSLKVLRNIYYLIERLR